jgi:hypothetical protein
MQQNWKKWEELIAYFPLRGQDRIENDVSNSIVACVSFAVVTFLPSRCQATIGEYTESGTKLCDVFMKYAIEMDSGVTIYAPSFIKIRSDVQKLIKRDTQLYRQQCDLISVHLFFQDKGYRLEI